MENLSDSSDEFVAIQSQVTQYENTFKGLIPEVKTTDLESWTLSSDGEINLKDLTYESGKHNGYVLAVAAVKDGDNNNVYINRLILESTSTTTLGQASYTEADQVTYGTTTNDQINTDSNPNTGISDYAIYLVPICIILGSAILLKKSYS